MMNSKKWLEVTAAVSTIIAAVASVVSLLRNWEVPGSVSQIETMQSQTIQQIVNVMEGTVNPRIDTVVMSKHDTILLQRGDTLKAVGKNHDTLYLPVPARKMENGRFRYVSPDEERKILSSEAAYRAQMNKMLGNESKK